MKLLVFLFGFAGFGFSQDLCISCNENLDSKIETIVFVDSEDHVVRKLKSDSSGVVVKGVCLLQESGSFLKKIEKQYVAGPLTCGSLSSLKQDVLDFYEKEGQPFVMVTIPKQAWDDGVVQVVVEEARLGNVHSLGNRYFSGSEMAGYIRTKPGSPVIARKVVEDLAWMNQNPFRRTDAIWVPGKQKGVVDLELLTEDRWPYRVYAGSDNTGTIATERNRIFAGFNFGKTLIEDSQISYQFTSSPNWNRFYAHTVSARIPCPWRHVAVFYGGYSQVEPSLENTSPIEYKELGTSWQIDARYRIPLMAYPRVMQEFVFGYDFKETELRLKERVPDSRSWSSRQRTADINQFMVGYELGYSDEVQRTTLVLELYGNPGGITTKNKSRDYREFRNDAKAEYAYLKGSHSFARKLPHDFWMSYDISAQVASSNLLSSEQLTLAGYSAVRGFEERLVNVDSGFVVNLELETPHVSFSKWFGKKREDEFYLLAFFDAGWGVEHRSCHGNETKSQTLGSIGPGARYQYSRYVTARFDYGFQLWHHGFDNASDSRYNFGVIVSY